MESEILTIREVAAESRHTRSAVENWIRKGIGVNGRRVKLAATRIGGSYRISREDLAAFVAALNPGPPPTRETPAAFAQRAAREVAEARRLLAGGRP